MNLKYMVIMGEIVTSGYAIFADESENLCWRSAKIMISLKSMMKMPNVSVQKRQIVALLFKQEVSPRFVFLRVPLSIAEANYSLFTIHSYL
jgi:hypothetical protein